MMADWNHSKPPKGLCILAFISGAVREGYCRWGYFIATDCTHPMQNTTLDIDSVDAWKYEGRP
jgi:hypothetical protein